MFDILIEIPHNVLHRVRDLYLVDWPKHKISYYSLQTYIEWFEYHNVAEMKNIKIYSLNENWLAGTVVISIGSRYTVFTLANENNRLFDALSILDWTVVSTLCACTDTQRATVAKFVKVRGLQVHEASDLMYFLSKKDGQRMEFKLPDNITLRPVKEEDVNTINEAWLYNGVEYLRRLIQRNISVGAYTEDGELIGWCLKMEFGCLGPLHVKKPYRRRGIGTALLKYAIRTLSYRNQDSLFPIKEVDVSTRHLLEKLGFELSGKVHTFKVKR